MSNAYNVGKPLYTGFGTCFGWGPQHQTTGARVLVGARSTKPQAHVFWLGPAAPNHRRTCFGWGPQHQTTGARVLVGARSTKPQTHVFWLGPAAPKVSESDSKTHLKSRLFGQYFERRVICVFNFTRCCTRPVSRDTRSIHVTHTTHGQARCIFKSHTCCTRTGSGSRRHTCRTTQRARAWTGTTTATYRHPPPQKKNKFNYDRQLIPIISVSCNHFPTCCKGGRTIAMCVHWHVTNGMTPKAGSACTQERPVSSGRPPSTRTGSPVPVIRDTRSIYLTHTEHGGMN